MDDYTAVDAIALQKSLRSPFNHHKLIPKKAMAAWRECYIVVGSELIEAVESRRGIERNRRLRRAAAYYFLLPQLLLRDMGDKNKKVTETILLRCTQFLNKDFGVLLNSWESDYDVSTTKKRNTPIDSDLKRAKQTVSSIHAAKPRCISRGVNRMTSNGRISIENRNVRDQMLKKHPVAVQRVTPFTQDHANIVGIPFSDLNKLIDESDLSTSAATRGFHPHYVYCLSRSRNMYQGSESKGIEVFKKLGEIVVANKVAWLSRALGGTVLTALRKKGLDEIVQGANPEDARPLNAKDCDASIWYKSAARAQTGSVQKMVEPQQVAVGVAGGTMLIGVGIKIELEEANINGRSFYSFKDDITNAFGNFDREAVAADITEAATANPDLLSFDMLARCVMVLEPEIHYRSTTNGDGYDLLCQNTSGGEQGNGTTSLIFCAGMNKPIKETERLFKVNIRAIMDDTTIFGEDPEECFGEGKALDFMRRENAKRGNKWNPTKPRAYANTPEGRAKIPANIKQHSYVMADGKRVYGMEVCGMALGDDGYEEMWLKDKADKAVAKIDFISKTIAELSNHASIAITIKSLQTASDFLLSTHRPSLTREYKERVNAALQRACAIGYRSDLLEPNHAVPDPFFTHDRSKSNCGNGGAGIYQLGDRHPYLNTLVNVIPQFIDRKDEKGVVTSKGFFAMLEPLVGQGSFNAGNEDKQWATIMASTNRYAVEMVEEFERAKFNHEALVNSISAYQAPAIPPESIFDKPMEELVAGPHVKLSKMITIEKQALKFESLTERASKLPVTDNRRVAFFANSKNRFANMLLGALPCPEVRFTSDEFSTAIAIHFGIDIPICKPYVGETIRNHAACPTLTVDSCGINLSRVTGCKGGDAQLNHNNLVKIISEGLRKAKIPQIGVANSQSCKSIFASAIPRGGVNINDTTSTNNLKSIIADLVINGQCVTDNKPLGGQKHIIDVKTLAAGYVYQVNSTTFSSVADKRGDEVTKEYSSTAKKLDTRVLNTPEGAIGGFTKILSEYGNPLGRVMGPTSGFYGEGSKDVGAICDLIARELAKSHVEYYRCDLSKAVSLFKFSLNRKWGQSIARGWAQLIINRLRNQVVYQGGEDSSEDSSSNEDEVNAQYGFFNGGADRGGEFFTQG